MRTITLDDCYELQKKFDAYCETAEQHEFALLFMVDTKMRQSIANFEEAGEIANQKDANAMFRVVLRVIHQDFSEYEET